MSSCAGMGVQHWRGDLGWELSTEMGPALWALGFCPLLRTMRGRCGCDTGGGLL